MNNEIIKRVISSIFLLPLTFFSIYIGDVLFNLFIFTLFCLALFEWTKFKIALIYKLVGFFFLIFSFYTVIFIRNYSHNGLEYIIILTLICISTDIGGYVFGKIFKGPRLTKISPKKTYSGLIGGYILSAISIIILHESIKIFSNFSLYNFNVVMLVFLISSMSQFGDIMISYFKRLSNIKDTGNIIPGHGGVLDRIDGMIFAFPFSYFLFEFNFFRIL